MIGDFCDIVNIEEIKKDAFVSNVIAEEIILDVIAEETILDIFAEETNEDSLYQILF